MNDSNDMSPMRSRREPFGGPIEAWVTLNARNFDADAVTRVLLVELAKELDGANKRINDLEDAMRDFPRVTPPRAREQMALLSGIEG